jgi:5-methylthioadenosine/S-adenosylhomocysteine deaminase
VELSEIEMLAQHGCSVAHCPSTDLRLASGIAPVPAMLARGVNVGVGTGGGAANSRLDMLDEIRIAALLAKGASGDAAAVPAHAALHMATLAGAKALGLEARIGSLAPGRRADMTAIRMSDLTLAPVYDALAHLVYAAGREQVTHVWVDGRLRVEDGVLTALDARELAYKAAHWKDRIRSA